MENLNLGNMYHYKKKKHPEWYENGEVTVYTKEQIAEYEASAQGKESLAKMEAAQQIDPELAKFLDAKKSGEAELEFKEQMKGFKG